jgi:hypothetical protein
VYQVCDDFDTGAPSIAWDSPPVLMGNQASASVEKGGRGSSPYAYQTQIGPDANSIAQLRKTFWQSGEVVDLEVLLALYPAALAAPTPVCSAVNVMIAGRAGMAVALVPDAGSAGEPLVMALDLSTLMSKAVQTIAREEWTALSVRVHCDASACTYVVGNATYVLYPNPNFMNTLVAIGAATGPEGGTCTILYDDVQIRVQP